MLRCVTMGTDLVHPVVDRRHVHRDVRVVLHQLMQACSKGGTAEW